MPEVGEVDLKFIQDPHDPAKNYYDAILLLHKPGKVFDHDEHNFENPSPNSLQLIMQDYADEVINLTDDSETTFMQHHVYSSYNNNNNDLQFPSHLFMNIVPEWVDDLPQDIDGMKIFKMKCLLREWVQKTSNLWFLKMHSSRRKGLIRTRKVGRCIDNLYCPYYDCPYKLFGKWKEEHFKLPEC